MALWYAANVTFDRFLSPGDFLGSDAWRNLAMAVEQQCGVTVVEGDACP